MVAAGGGGGGCSAGKISVAASASISAPFPTSPNRRPNRCARFHLRKLRHSSVKKRSSSVFKSHGQNKKILSLSLSLLVLFFAIALSYLFHPSRWRRHCKLCRLLSVYRRTALFLRQQGWRDVAFFLFESFAYNNRCVKVGAHKLRPISDRHREI